MMDPITINEARKKASEEMMVAGQRALEHPDTPEKLKKFIRNEMENQKHLMEAFDGFR